MEKFKKVLSDMDSKTYLFGAIFVISNKLQQLGDEFDERITLKQWRVLTAIAFCQGEEGASISDIAEFTSSSGQNVKKIAVILKKKKYVDIIQDSKDARYVRMSVTKQAEELFEERKEKEEKFFQELFKGIDDETVNTMNEGYRKLFENMEGMQLK